MSKQRRNDRFPRYNHRRRRPDYPAFARVECSSCSFAAHVVSLDPRMTPTDCLDALIASDCLGCPRCWGDLNLFIPAELSGHTGTPG